MAFEIDVIRDRVKAQVAFMDASLELLRDLVNTYEAALRDANVEQERREKAGEPLGAEVGLKDWVKDIQEAIEIVRTRITETKKMFKPMKIYAGWTPSATQETPKA